MPDALTLTALYTYPLKSARGVALTRAHLGPRGLDLDRHWMVVDAQGRQLTGRQHPKLGLIEVEVGPDALHLSVAGLDDLTVPLRPEGTPREVSIWHEPLPARSVGERAQRWFEAYLDRPCDLVQLDPAMARRRHQEADGAPISFVDGNPLHLVSEDSLADLNTRLNEPVPVQRFRPNMVVSGALPYAEDGWTGLHSPALDFAVVQACIRCSMVNIEAGQMRAEPLRTLAGYRRWGRHILFGQNLIHAREGWLEVGEPLWAGGTQGRR